MSSRSSKQDEPRPKKHHSSSSEKRSKSDDWSGVTEPEERRRIQNRIAQRKFREKMREKKEMEDRDAQNQANAGNNYQTAVPLNYPEDNLSGLPWGSLHMGHIVTKGLEHSQAHQGSGQDEYPAAGTSPYAAAYVDYSHAPSYGGSSGADDGYYGADVAAYGGQYDYGFGYSQQQQQAEGPGA